MTTICYRDGTLAADSLISYQTITCGNRSKIVNAGSHLIALAGPIWLRFPLEEWVSGGCVFKNVPAVLLENECDFSCLIVDRSGIAYEFTRGYLVPVHSSYYAIGSGGLLALGAMAHGASAVEAVEAAGKHDKNTGGTVHSAHFNTLS